MLYREFGQTGKKISVISFGGMRFRRPYDPDSCAELLHHAHGLGINYFDTAPVYCADRSEDIFGRALAQLPRESFYLSSKCSRAKASDFRKSLERSLTRLRTDHIDFFYIWHLMTPEDWEGRKRGGAVEAALQAREEGLIGHLLCSSHMEGKGLSAVLAENIFAGVLLGFNALNFPYRLQAVEEAGKQGLGVVTMNPLAGGLIPQNPDRFAFLKTGPDDTVVRAALRFNLSHEEISSALVGFSSREEIDQAVAAADTFTPLSPAEKHQLAPNIEQNFDRLCTGCGYCLPCPADIPIPKFMDVYNQVMLNPGPDTATTRLRMHWGLTAEQAQDCITCGACEARCTQHLPIIERLRELAAKEQATA